MKSIIVDAGPLIALFANDDQYHLSVTKFMKGHTCKLITTWPVLTEVCHMLDKHKGAQNDFLEWVKIGGLTIVNLPNESIARILSLSKKYHDTPMDLADASLVVLAEIHNTKEIITIDSDYDVYRIFKKEKFNNLLKKYL